MLRASAFSAVCFATICKVAFASFVTTPCPSLKRTAPTEDPWALPLCNCEQRIGLSGVTLFGGHEKTNDTAMALLARLLDGVWIDLVFRSAFFEHGGAEKGL